MKAEIIAVGTELLLGQIVNTNAQYLSRELAGLGIDLYFQTVVGDNMSRLTDAIQLAADRADLVIMTGGIGPTQDDLTKEALARFAGRDMHYDRPSLARIEDLFRKRNMPVTDNNRKQALVLSDSAPLPNDTGLAVGVALKHGDNLFIVLPGPPREMKPMFERYAKTWIRRQMREETPLFSKILKFAGIGESGLEQELEDLIKKQKEVTIAPYAQEGEVALRLSTKATDEQQAAEKFKLTEERIRVRVGRHLFAESDIPLERAVVERLKEMGKTVAVAESCTGGVLSSLFTSVPGSSAVFKGGFIAYTNELKQNVLDVPAALLEEHGAISTQTAEKMALNTLKLSGADYALATTGVAGPDQAENKPVGLVYVALASAELQGDAGGGGSGNALVRSHDYRMAGNREIVQIRTAKYALHRLWSALSDHARNYS